MRRYVLVIAACLGVVVLTGASPIADLLSRVEALEADNQSLKAELNKQPVMIDANGIEVGTVVELENRGVEGNKGTIVIDLPGAPLFTLRVTRNALGGTGNRIGLLFETTDCSGQVYVESGSSSDLLPPVAYGLASGETWIGVGDLEDITLRSVRSLGDGSCGSLVPSEFPARAAISIPEMEGLYTPPFEVVTRGDLAR